MDVRGKRVLVVGLARSGYAAAVNLQRHGAEVTVSDIRPPWDFQDLLPKLVKQKIGLEFGSQREETFLRHDLIVLSPGVPWDLPELQAARQRQIPVFPEVEAASWFLEGTLVGITGSNGKTTTTTLLGKILEASGFPTFVGGNIGVPLSLAVDQAEAGSVFVTELSSFQLEAIQDFRPQVAIYLNLSSNHLDRHPTFEAYAQAKRQIFRNQQGEDYAILNADDPAVAALAPGLAGRAVFFSRRRELPGGIFVSNGHIIYRIQHLERVLLEKSDVHLRGEFNLENVLAATTAACVLGADFRAIRAAVREFRGGEHRLEFVREIRDVEYYNNSKATSVDATLKSLEAFEHGVHLILGGKDKGAPYTPLLPLIKERARAVYLIGAAARTIGRELAGAVELVVAGDLETAVQEAFRRSEPGDTVLLAPACSSFDQFKDYEHRGRVFKDLVAQLAQKVEGGGADWFKSPTVPPTVVSTPAITKPQPRTAPPVQSPAPEPASGPAGTPEEQIPVATTIDEPAPASEETEQAEPPAKIEQEPAAEPEEVIPAFQQTEEPEASASEEAGCEEVAAAEPLDRPRILELTYVYEMGAEEFPPAEIETRFESGEETEAWPGNKFGVLEAVEDEPLPFEARATVAATVSRAEEGRTKPGGTPAGESQTGEKSHGGGPPRSPSTGQGRLPGMD